MLLKVTNVCQPLRLFIAVRLTLQVIVFKYCKEHLCFIIKNTHLEVLHIR